MHHYATVYKRATLRCRTRLPVPAFPVYELAVRDMLLCLLCFQPYSGAAARVNLCPVAVSS